jgi:VCBS repeat-containing protein
VIDAGGIDRLLRVYPYATLRLQRVSLTGGRVTDVSGGGILNMGTLRLDRVVVAGNRTEGLDGIGGGIALWGGAAHILESTISDNRAHSGGGVFIGNDAMIDIERSTLMTNYAVAGGGAIYSFGGTAQLTNSTLSGNDARSSGGAIYASRGQDGPSSSATVSADGRFVAFSSTASNLVPGDVNGSEDVFVLDRQTGKIERVSAALDYLHGSIVSRSPSISGTGRFVGFEVYTNSVSFHLEDVFIYDRQTGTIQRVSGNTPDSYRGSPSLSEDGRFVAFFSDVPELLVFDRETGHVERVCVGYDWGDFGSPSLSADGQFVAFSSTSSNLVPGDTNGHRDVFVFDRHIAKMERVSIAQDGQEANGSSGSLSVSEDGRFIAFDSYASNLVLGDTNNRSDVFLVDRLEGTIDLVSIAHNGDESNGSSFAPSLSADGQLVAFSSTASNLVPESDSSTSNVFLFDRLNGSIERISVAYDGSDANGPSYSPTLSGNGQVVSFSSDASNLVAGDSNDLRDTFVVDRLHRVIQRVNLPLDSHQAYRRSS